MSKNSKKTLPKNKIAFRSNNKAKAAKLTQMKTDMVESEGKNGIIDYEMQIKKALDGGEHAAAASLYFDWALKCFNRGDFEGILQVASKARVSFGDYLDLQFITTLALYSAGRHDEALHSAERYLEMRDDSEALRRSYLSVSFDSLGDLLWLAGECATRTGEVDRAHDFQKRSIEADPGNHYRRIMYAVSLGKNGKVDEAISFLDQSSKRFPGEIAFDNAKALVYGDAERLEEARDHIKSTLKSRPGDIDAIINLGVICEKLNDFEEAENCYKKALTINPGHEVALGNQRFLKSVIDETPARISLCMILKNEEKFLPGCLGSVKGLVDEIIVVDTGSTDRTMEIAREYGAKIYEHPWQNDFSYHRNQSINYATGNWILIIDADEELDSSEHGLIRSAILRKDVDALSFVVYNKIQHGRTGFLVSHRLFRNNKGYHYEGIVHNQLIFDGVALTTPFKVIHHGYGLPDDEMRDKGNRSEALLMKQLELNPDNAFAHFNLAQIYRGMGEPEKSLKHALKVIELMSPQDEDRRHIYIMALDQIGCAYVGINENEKAKEYFYKAIDIKNDYLDPWFNLGYVYAQESDYDKADNHFNRYLEIRNSFKEHKEWVGLILNNLNSQFAAHYGLAISQIHKGHTNKAIEYLNGILEQMDDFEQTHLLLARCYRAEKDFEKTIHHCDKALEYNHAGYEMYILKGEGLLNFGRAQEAAICFKKAQELNTSDSAASMGLAAAASLDGDLQAAMKYINQVLETTPNLPQALSARGDMLYHFGNYSKAAENYKSKTVSNPNSPDAWNNLGNCYYKQSNFSSADECYRKVIQFSPSFPLAYRNLGLSLLRQNSIEEATSSFEEYLTFSPNDLDVKIVLADLNYSLKRYWKAIYFYEVYLQKYSSNFDAMLRLSDCYFNLGKLEAAKMGYMAILKRQPQNETASRRLKSISDYVTA